MVECEQITKKAHTMIKGNTLSITAITVLASTLFTADISAATNESPYKSKYETVILYTNDVHCFADENIGYAGLAAYRKEMLKQTPYVAMVDGGDHLQGNAIGTLTKGENIVDIMNHVRYDFATIGNHEFDYGLDVLKARIDSSNTQYLASNVKYTGVSKDPFAKTVPYAIKRFGVNRIGFIGIVTPRSIGSSNPDNFREDKKIVVNLCGQNNGQNLFDTVQATVNSCRQNGADYVIALSHLGTSASVVPFDSKTLIANTTGIDAVLDAHSHSIIPFEKLTNKDGKEVILTSTGTGLERIGKLTISAEGIKTELISDYKGKDQKIAALIARQKEALGAELNNEIGISNTSLSITTPEGARIVRNRECGIGNWVTDAMAFTAGTEIALCNGGGIRSDLKAGKVSYMDLLAIHTFNNKVTKLNITGQKLLDILESCYQHVGSEAVAADGTALNESGSFLQVAGLKLTIDASKPTPIKKSNEGTVIEGDRRVEDVLVKVNGNYEPIDPAKSYMVAVPNYMVNNKKGAGNVNEDSILEIFGIIPDAMAEHFKHIKGDLSQYANIEGRITVK